MFQYSTKRKKKSNIFELALIFFMIKYNENKKIDIYFHFFYFKRKLNGRMTHGPTICTHIAYIQMVR